MKLARALLVVSLFLAPAAAADKPPERKPLSPGDRTAVLALISAVDLAQQTDVLADGGVAWDSHILKSANQTAYVPFRLSWPAEGDAFKSALMYVRAVSRRNGMRAKDERSVLREALLRPATAPRVAQRMFVGPGEMPVGGPAAGSARRSTAGPAEASAILTLQQREVERQKAAEEAAKKKEEARERDPLLFPFEDYFVLDLKSAAASTPRLVERALGLPPGEYDIYVALIDRARLKTSSPAIAKRTMTVPDFWNEELTLSSVILAKEIRGLKAALPAQQQLEHPYTFGRAEVLPVPAPSFSTSDQMSIVFQICNYGAPDADLTADYVFFRTDEGTRRIFNRTDTQEFTDDDLPASNPFDTYAFASQALPMEPFPPGTYELEITVRDRLTRRSTSRIVPFSVTTK